MSGFSNYLENATLNHIFGTVPYTKPANVFLALYTSAPSDSGGGTEVSGSGYSRKSVTFATVIDGAIASSNVVSYTPAGGNYGTIVATALFDAATGGNMLTWDTITPVTLNIGDTLSFAVGSVIVSLD